MDIKRHFGVTVFAIFFICANVAIAQEVGIGLSEPSKSFFKPVPISPEKSARKMTDRMDSLLHLTEKQYDKLYKLNLKWAREDADNKMPAPHMGNRPEGMPDFDGGAGFGHGPQGNRPPEGFDRRPPRDLPPLANMEKIEKQRKKRDKKLKKLLTDEQYACWMEKRQLFMPEDMRKEKREECE